MPTVEPGKQYLVVICKNCAQLTPFVEVGKGSEIGISGGIFEIQCAACGHKADYPASELRMLETHYKQ